ncbi:hypothetical protein BS47DRAFT_1396545 [Hydnum rufescens UP504]|uniref:Uncharacterized protein n=1 Tax=Hydnum rufescens UP504 TaxID=1448309 RepID=A0A9P6DQ99_9AGAM|nr:hypothetical protein BS47DRAFT_1396545 [Hydnum rufescens UP504]
MSIPASFQLKRYSDPSISHLLEFVKHLNSGTTISSGARGLFDYIHDNIFCPFPVPSASSGGVLSSKKRAPEPVDIDIDIDSDNDDSGSFESDATPSPPAPYCCGEPKGRVLAKPPASKNKAHRSNDDVNRATAPSEVPRDKTSQVLRPSTLDVSRHGDREQPTVHKSAIVDARDDPAKEGYPDDQWDVTEPPSVPTALSPAGSCSSESYRFTKLFLEFFLAVFRDINWVHLYLVGMILLYRILLTPPPHSPTTYTA